MLDILNKALPVLSEPFTPDDINRYHPIGKLNKKNYRQVIIRFSNYKANAKAYDVRFNLSKVNMNEDFTPTKQQFINQLIHLRKGRQIKKFWSIDGKIFAKVVYEQGKFRIKSKDDISDIFLNALEEGYIDDDEAITITKPPGATDDTEVADNSIVRPWYFDFRNQQGAP